MLKILPLANISHQPKAKCGEIFCHSSSDFTIFCTFCDMKAFTFEDFLLHIQNVHFENNILKTESFTNDPGQYLQVNVKAETITETKLPQPALASGVAIGDQLHEEEMLWDNLQHNYDNDVGGNDVGDDEYGHDDMDDSDDSFEEEVVTVLKKTKKTKRTKKQIKKEKSVKSDIESGEDDEDNDHSSDEDFKPAVSLY